MLYTGPMLHWNALEEALFTETNNQKEKTRGKPRGKAEKKRKKTYIYIYADFCALPKSSFSCDGWELCCRTLFQPQYSALKPKRFPSSGLVASLDVHFIRYLFIYYFFFYNVFLNMKKGKL